jgi:fibronectin-binding autotransporter adhesin
MKATFNLKLFSRRSASTAVLLFLGHTLNPASAADKTWDGEGANNFWQTAGNWDPIGGGAAPVANDSLIFDGTLRLTPVNDFAAGTVFGNLTFASSADAFTLSGNSVTLPMPPSAAYTGGLNAPYLGGSISNLSFNVEAINLALTLGDGHHYIIGNAGGGSLNLGGAVTLSSAASVTFSTGVNTTGSGLANVNGILGGWATMNPPTTWAALDESGNVVDYTAFTDVAAGGAIASSAGINVRIPDSGANVTLAAAGTTDINTLHFGTAPIANQIVDVAAGRVLRFGAKGGIFNASRQITGTSRVLTIGTGTGVGAVTAGGADNTPGDLYLIETPFIGNTGNQLVMNSRITNNGTGAVTVHTFGHISFPNVSHTYSGGTYIHGGRIQTQPNILGFGPIYVYPGGQLFFNANGTCTNDIFLAGFGNAESLGNGAIRMGGTGRIITGTITLMADAATANGTFNGRITGPGGLIVGAGNGNGVGTMIIGATNDYAGDTVINGTNSTAASTLQINTGRLNIMPHGTGKGNLILNGAGATPAVATFHLNGTSQIINGLNSVGASANAIVTSGAAGSVTLTVGDGNANGSFGGIIQNGSGAVGLVKIGTGTQTLTGANTYTNGTTVHGGKLVFATANSFPTAGAPLITVNSNATLDVGAVSAFTLGAGSALTMSNGTIVIGLTAAGNAITTPTLSALGSTNYVTIASIPSIASYPAQFVAIKYTALDGALNYQLAGPLPASPGTPFTGYISNNVANGSVDFVVTGGPSTINWVGYSSGAPSSAWDTTTPNWATLGGAPTTYSDGVFVRFRDSASNGIVTLSQTVSPASISVSNTSLAYTLNGGSGITGAGSLTKQGSGTLILNNGFNDFSGGVTVSAGTLQVGNNDSSGNLPESGSVVNNGALVFARDAITVANVISGTGAVTQNSSGSLTLSGANTYAGATTVSQGTLVTGNNAALGTTNGGTTVVSGATLDVGANAINLGQEVITVSGTGVGGGGALVNNSGSFTFVGPNAARVVMAADTTVGGTGRFDLRSNPTGNPALGSLLTGGIARKLTKVGPGTFGLIGITVDPALGDIDVQQGTFSVEAAMTSLGNPANNLIVHPGATFQMFAATNLLNKSFILGGDGLMFTLSATSGGNTIIGPMNITNDCLFSANPAAVSLTLSNVITGPGKISKVGLGSLTLSGNSPNYAGGLQLNAGNATISGTLSNGLGVNAAVGKLVVNGTLLGGGVTNSAAATLAGSGSSAGFVDVSGGLLPGDTNVVGTFTAGGLALQFGATLSYDLASVNTAGSGVNDLIAVNGDLTVNGNAITINPLGLLQLGVPYRLFNYTGSLIWNGDLSVSGPNNYVFTVNTNTPGQINIVASGGPPVWNGGSATVNNWTDPANWNGVTIVPGDTLFFAGNNRLNNTNNTAPDTSYTDIAFNSDAGPFVLNGNSIVLGGNLINNSPNLQTVRLAMSLNGNRSFNGTSGALSVVGNVTNTVNASVLTLGGTGILANVLTTVSGFETNTLLVNSNASWTLVDNASSTAVTNPTQLDIQAGTFSFGTGSSSPVFTSTTGGGVNARLGVAPNAPAVFNMVGGTLTIAARLNTGAAANTLATINQSGGSLNVMDVLQISDSAATASTAVNVTGGTINVANAGAFNNFFLASRGTGILTVASSAVINCATLDLSRNAAGNTLGSVGVVNLNGGTLHVSRVGAATSAAQAGGTPTATFNFNGGTLKARASSATFFQGNATAPVLPIASIVKAGGAIIDTDTNAISVLEPLQHDSTLGATPDGGLIKQGSGTLTLTAASTYTGGTIVSNGTLLVNGSIGATAVSVENSGQLGGVGNIGGSVTVKSGGTITAGAANAAGNLTVAGNVTMQSGAIAFMELNKSTAASDQVRAIAGTPTTITYAGTLSLANLAGTLAAGDSFKLFSASNYLGSFSSITPASPGPGLQWVTSALNSSGTISIAALPIPRITTFGVVDGNVVLSGTNGPAGGTYWVLTSTDAALPISSWTSIATNSFNGSGNFSFTNGAPSDPQRFYLLRVP